MGQMDKGKDKKATSTMNQKMKEDALAYIRTLAQLRKRDVKFAEKAVLDASTLTATEALQSNVINVIANNKMALLQKLDGIMVVQDGKQIKLDTKDVVVESVLPDWRMKFLQIITDPTIAYMLFLLGIYGIFFELVNPGFLAPGVIGAVAMVVALYALQLLPINYAGLALIILGLTFIIAESFVPSFGSLGLGGTISFVVGSIMLMDTDLPAYQIAWSAIWAMAAVNIIIFVFLLSMAIKARRKPVQHGTDALVGSTGRTINEVNLEGQAVIRGEIWWVISKKPIEKNKLVRVVDAKGLKLTIEEFQGD
jgi:membrane-bound serine protease (ClpP class)